MMKNLITKIQLKSLLEDELMSVRLSVKDAEVNIEPRLYLKNTTLSTRGYTVTAGGVSSKVKNFVNLTDKLSELGADEDCYRLIKIDGTYDSVEELEEKKRFDQITMAEILEKYKTADRFELVTRLLDFAISEEQAQKSYGKIAEEQKRWSKNRYDRFSEEARAKLPDFETLYAQIVNECKRYRAKNAAQIEKNDGLAFFCDEFSRGNTQFTEPTDLWHVYHSVDFVESCAYQIDKARKKQCCEKEESEQHPELENYPALQAALIGAEVTFTWHCTTSGAPAKVFSFRLNDETRAWLLTRKDDYDMPDGLEDLALYRGEKILFSSCTHEHFHNDCEEK